MISYKIVLIFLFSFIFSSKNKYVFSSKNQYVSIYYKEYFIQEFIYEFKKNPNKFLKELRLFFRSSNVFIGYFALKMFLLVLLYILFDIIFYLNFSIKTIIDYYICIYIFVFYMHVMLYLIVSYFNTEIKIIDKNAEKDYENAVKYLKFLKKNFDVLKTDEGLEEYIKFFQYINFFRDFIY